MNLIMLTGVTQSFQDNETIVRSKNSDVVVIAIPLKRWTSNNAEVPWFETSQLTSPACSSRCQHGTPGQGLICTAFPDAQHAGQGM